LTDQGVFYHVVGDEWCEGQPLRCWDDLVADGVLTAADWGRPERGPVGYDGSVVSLFANLIDARVMNTAGERIVRVRIPGDRLGDLKRNAEEYWCYPREISAKWLEIVGAGETS
jgi:hypothetical protein